MIVGLGGNNGSTLAASLHAHKLNVSWETKDGIQTPNYYGSYTQCSSVKVGVKYNKETGCLSDVHSIVKDLLPMVSPADIELTGWDISAHNLFAACKRACVLETDLVN